MITAAVLKLALGISLGNPDNYPGDLRILLCNGYCEVLLFLIKGLIFY
jgi:hypothetical protein